MTPAAGPGAAIAAVIAARNEADRVAATVRAARTLPGVDLIVVVDDGSTDSTVAAAAGAGARVLRHGRTRGKGAAMESGAEGVQLIEAHTAAAGTAALPRHLLFLDADLGASAALAAPLIAPVRAGTAAVTVALLPPSRSRMAGQGIILRLARDGVRRATDWEPEQPLSGQRCMTRAAFEAARPLAAGFGVEVALTIDLLRRGHQVLEVEVPLEHRPTGTGPAAQAHRARQLRDVGRALAVRTVVPAVRSGARTAAGSAAASVSRGVARVRHAVREKYPHMDGR
ncbi:glycosyl transferase family 2 [Murinocardiopsis flavida]|uniref:Glucosyl-3-phosphoglycerate synthase n=1 Tax=Murinocardiopsis flavida TaxID=645275 RepID=A0A2P8DQ71_9ACTN|nr:glycosyltransferase [Murinocardiopsis flavida]PSK99344.1 glycosyl transferase family 2 [Murinocardiopsis flavida]